MGADRTGRRRGRARRAWHDRGVSSPAKLSSTALAFRGAHAAITGCFLFAIGYVWWCALTGRRDTLLRVAITGLIGEGALVMANGGDCPLGGLQDRVGDPTPLFELILSPTAAKRAVPVLGAIAGLGIALLGMPGARNRSGAHPASECPTHNTRRRLRVPIRRC